MVEMMGIGWSVDSFVDLDEKNIPKWIQKIALKCEGAHKNGHECFPLFVGAVVCLSHFLFS